MFRFVFILLLFPASCFATNCNIRQVQHNNVEQVVVQQRVVQFSNDYYLGTGGYFAHGEALKAEREASHQSQIKALEDQNKLLRDILETLSGKKTEQPNNPTPIPTPEPPKPAGTDLENKVLKIFQTSCAKCHNENKAESGLVLVDKGALPNLDLVDAVLIHHRINAVNLDGDSRMPKGSTPLDTDDVEIIRQYMVSIAKSQVKKITKE